MISEQTTKSILWYVIIICSMEVIHIRGKNVTLNAILCYMSNHSALFSNQCSTAVTVPYYMLVTCRWWFRMFYEAAQPQVEL